jgi:thiol-disulfide isomerase/thioredoxin
MSIDYDKLYKRLEEKVEEGIALLPRATIGEEGYRQLLEDIVETISLIKNFDSIGQEDNQELESMQGDAKTIQIGDPYMSLDGSSDDRKVVMFSSDGCTFCNLAKPVYLPALAKAGVPVEIVSLDEQEGNEFAQRLGIQGIPAFLFVKDGIVTNAFQGYDTKITDEQNKKNLLNAVERFL